MENGEQKIFVWCDFSEQMSDAILHGLQVALILKKELCLLNIPDSKSNEGKSVVELRLKLIAEKVIEGGGGVNVHYMVSERPLKRILTDLIEVYDSLLLVAPKISAPSLVKALPKSRFPFLFVSGSDNVEGYYKRIVVPVGYMKRCKDLALWASYLSRHNNGSVELFASKESGRSDNEVMRKNLSSIVRLFKCFSFGYSVVESNAPTWKLAKAAFYHVCKQDYSMLMIAVNHRPFFLDRFIGMSERDIIDGSGNTPVFCINSQKHLCTLCG
jgi:hypothetical protein